MKQLIEIEMRNEKKLCKISCETDKKLMKEKKEKTT